jgi:fumarylacetoacetate (FAA) hydrolase
MKLGSLPDGSRDGRLVVVSRDLTVCSDARHIAPSLDAALADWDAAAPELDLIARGIEALGQPLERFHERAARAPLPRAGAAHFEAPRSPIRAGVAALAAEIGFALVGGEGAPPRLFTLVLDLGPAGATLSPAAVTEDELGHGTFAIRVSGRSPVRIDAPVLPPHLPDAPAAGVVPLAPIAVLTLHPGDTIRVEYCDRAGHSVFGAIEREVAAEALAEG